MLYLFSDWGFGTRMWDGAGKSIIQPRYKYLNFTGVSVENDGILVDVNGSKLRGVVDKNGNWLLKPVYEKLERCGKDRFIAKIAENRTK